MLQAILFDLDGTLANTDPIHFGLWQTFLKDYGYDEIDLAFYQRHISGGFNPDIVKALLPQLSAAEGEKFSVDKEAAFRVVAADQLHRLPGLDQLLAWIDQQGLKQAVVTNAPRTNAEFMLKTLNLWETFETVIIGEELPRAKPDPMPYQEALKRLKIAPEAAVVFEDSSSGVKAAIAAGIPTIGMATTHSPEALYELGVKLVIEDFTDPRLLDFGISV